MSLLERHWLLVIDLFLAIILALLYTRLDSNADSTSFDGLLVAVLPALVASLVAAAVVYVFLRTGPPEAEIDRPIAGTNALSSQLEELSSQLATHANRESPVRTRSDLPRLESLFEGATSIDIAAISASALINRARGLLGRELGKGTTLRVVLLDGNRSDALAAWDRLSNPPMNTPAHDIEAGLLQFLALRDTHGSAKCEVRVLDTVLPYSLIRVERDGDAFLQLEVHGFRLAPEDRLNLVLSQRHDPEWYELFHHQFEAIWSASTVPAPAMGNP